MKTPKRGRACQVQTVASKKKLKKEQGKELVGVEKMRMMMEQWRERAGSRDFTIKGGWSPWGRSSQTKAPYCYLTGRRPTSREGTGGPRGGYGPYPTPQPLIGWGKPVDCESRDAKLNCRKLVPVLERWKWLSSSNSTKNITVTGAAASTVTENTESYEIGS